MKDNEWAGVGNHNTALFWEYGTREARRFNRDPRVHTSESPYAVFGNSPLACNDILGDDKFKVNKSRGEISFVEKTADEKDVLVTDDD